MNNYASYMPNSTSYENAHTNTYDSTLKKNIDIWYRDNLLTNYDSYISQTAIYCNDRSIYSGVGYGRENVTYYGAYERLRKTLTPQFKCPELTDTTLYGNLAGTKNNMFTVSETTGNGDLTYGIAAISADEVVYAGSIYKTNNFSDTDIYLNTNLYNAPYLTMTPYVYELDLNSKSYYTIWPLYAYGSGIQYLHWQSLRIRPVLSLKSCVKYVTGDGTESNPYKVAIDSSCESAIN